MKIECAFTIFTRDLKQHNKTRKPQAVKRIESKTPYPKTVQMNPSVLIVPMQVSKSVYAIQLQVQLLASGNRSKQNSTVQEWYISTFDSQRLCSKCHTIILLLLFLQHAVCMLRIVFKFSVCMKYPDDLLYLPESAKYNSSILKSVQKLCSEWHTIIQLLL